MKTIKDLRKKRNLTQNEASKLLDIKKNYLSAIECGVRNPSDKLKMRMSSVYKVPIADIFLSLQTTKCGKTKRSYLNELYKRNLD